MQLIQLPEIKIDNSILLSLKVSKDEFINEMKLYTAINLYKKRKLSLGKAAQLLNVDRIDFINLLKQEKIPIFDYTNSEIDEIANDAKDLEKELK